MNCRGYDAFGRKKRAISDDSNDTDVSITGNLLSGQLREEITIESNAILTFERREERFVDPTEGKQHFIYKPNLPLFPFCPTSSYTNQLSINMILMYIVVCSPGRTESGRHLRVDDRVHHSAGDNGAAGSGRGGRGRVLLADGLQAEA